MDRQFSTAPYNTPILLPRTERKRSTFGFGPKAYGLTVWLLGNRETLDLKLEEMVGPSLFAVESYIPGPGP